MLKDLINNGGFKPENARAGFNSTGIHPLDRSKITHEKIAIGSVFQAVENDNIVSLFESSNVSSPHVLRNITNITLPLTLQ